MGDKEIETLEYTQVEIDKVAEKIIERLANVHDSRLNQKTEVPETEFKSFGEFLTTIRYNPGDARLKAMSEGVDSSGGFLVPEQFIKQLLMDSLEMAVVRKSGATVIPMTSDTAKIPRIVDTSHSSSVFGGVIAYWTEEAGSKTASQPDIGQIELIAKKLTGYTYASDELLADSAIGLEALLRRMFAEALAWYEDDAFINGTGVGQPLGVLNSGALLCINRSAATTVALADVANMWGRLLPQSHSRAVFLANPSVLPQIVQLASTSVVWLSVDQGAAKTPPATLLGRPLYFSEKLPALGTCGDILLMDPGYYLIGDRQKITMASSIHARFTTDETAWRFVERVDGQPWVDSAFTPKAGSTLSPFVALYTATTGGD